MTDEVHDAPERPSSREEGLPLTVTTSNVMTRMMDKMPSEDRRHLSQFDRNLTVEKAHFGDAVGNVVRPLAEPSSPPGNGTEGRGVRAKQGKERPRPTRKRTPKRPLKASKNTSPTEYFHRSLADAVSHAELSDEMERYVYPYRPRREDDRATAASIAYQRLRPIRSSPGSSPRRGMIGMLREVRSSPQVDIDLESGGRPMMRSHVKHRPFGPPSKLGNGTGSGGYSSDDELEVDDEGEGLEREERMPLLGPLLGGGRSLPHKDMSWSHILGIVVAAALLLCTILAYMASPLKNVEADLGRVLASSKELIFDLHVQALNPNWWSVQVADADLSVFAFSQIVPLNILSGLGSAPVQLSGAEPAEFLGSVTHLDEAFVIPSYRHDNTWTDTTVSQIRIKSPGDDQNGNERWTRMIRYPYGLVVRGVLQYRPFLLTHSDSTAICDVVLVDPTTGVVSKNPDQTYCSGDMPSRSPR